MATDAALPPASPLRSPLGVSAWCVTAAFGAYFCMYAFRKPFTASTYDGMLIAGISYKTLLVTAQVIGYTVSKFVGIKVIAEMTPGRRVAWLLGLIGAAEAALLLFAVTPMPFNIVFLFLNGLPLGMVFGLALGFLEGRRQTEALTAGLCASFIVADGVTRTCGAEVRAWGLSDAWMPFVTGLLFVPPLLIFAWMLSRIPAPTRDDVADRSARLPMDRSERRRFFWRYAFGLTLLVLIYLLFTVLRSVRGDFAAEIWAGLGTNEPSVFARSELAVGLAVFLCSGLAVFIRDHRLAFFMAMSLALAGTCIVGAALVGLRAGAMSPFAFMVLHGLGLYLPYVVFHTTVFERLIALTRDRGNIGYLMYLADAFGYLGYVAVMLGKNFLTIRGDFVDFFITLSWIIVAASVVLIVPCWRYFAALGKAQTKVTLQPAEVGADA